MMVSWETGELLVEEVQQGKDSGVKRLAERQPEEMGPGKRMFCPEVPQKVWKGQGTNAVVKDLK